MSQILITGGAGFIGSALLHRALAGGHSVLNVDKLTYAANPNSLSEIENNPNYQFLRADICDRAAMDKAFSDFKPDVIFHLAAESHVDRSIDGAADFIQTNVVGTFTLLEAARAYDRPDGFRFVHVSTDEVFGDLSADDPAFTESHNYAPSSPYSASKAGSDHLVRAWGRTYGLPILLTNCSNNYGPRQHAEKLIPVVIAKALRREPIPIYGTGENIRDWLYVDDHADALMTVWDKGALGESYNIGGNAELTNIDLVTKICAILDDRLGGAPHSDLISFVTDRPGHDRRYAMNISKIESDLGWTPKMKLEDGLAATVDWYLNNREWWVDNFDGKRQGLKT